jgi:D-alanyl-D-alanine carboxypeptidase (penicillin-binding protein 5/6)
MGRMPRLRVSLSLSAALLATLLALVSFSLAAPVSVATEIPHYQPPAPPPLTATSVFVLDITSDTELFALNPDAPLPPASLTKIVSALVILDRANLEDTVEIVATDRVQAEESQVGLEVGDRLTVRDLLFGTLIPSGNDAAMALARHVGSAALGDDADEAKSVEAFVDLMNEKAAALGATESHFVNPTGIDADGHLMTARDVARLAAAALQNPLFAEIVATPTAVLTSELRPDGYTITTTNLLLQEGIVKGVKTGSTPRAGGCLVTAFSVGPNTILAVVLGSEVDESSEGIQDNSARFADTRVLISAVSDSYVWLDPASPGIVAGLSDELSVWEAELVDNALLPVPASAAAELRYRLVLLPPADPDQPVGDVEFFVGERLLSVRPALQAG